MAVSNVLLCGTNECYILYFTSGYFRENNKENLLSINKSTGCIDREMWGPICVGWGLGLFIVYCVSFMQGCSSDGRNMYKIKYSMCLKNNSKLARLGFGILSKYEENKQSKSVKQRFLNMNRHYPIAHLPSSIQEHRFRYIIHCFILMLQLERRRKIFSFPKYLF